jgi:hypothetical protein
LMPSVNSEIVEVEAAIGVDAQRTQVFSQFPKGCRSRSARSRLPDGL